MPLFLDFDKNLQIKSDFDQREIKSCWFLLVTHTYGFPQKIEIIKSILSLNDKMVLIEDISHAQGAKINDKMVGTIGKGSFMSMQGDKAVNAGEGGLVITNNMEVYNRLIYLSHLNRKTFKENKLNLLSKIGFIGKGRMSPLGAITASNDIKNLNKRNSVLRKKLLLYDYLKNIKIFMFQKLIIIMILEGFIMEYLSFVIQKFYLMTSTKSLR